MADYYAGLHPDDAAQTAAAFAAALDPQRRALYDVEYRAIGQEDGVVRWVAAKGRGIFEDDGRCVRVIGTAIDITERKRMENALRETLANEIRALYADLPIVLLCDRPAILEGKYGGDRCTSVLAKPFRVSALKDTLNDVATSCEVAHQADH